LETWRTSNGLNGRQALKNRNFYTQKSGGKQRSGEISRSFREVILKRPLGSI